MIMSSKRERRRRLNRLLVLCLAFSLVLGQLIAAPPAQAAGISIFVDGTQLKTDVAPFIQNDRVMIPFRALFEGLGATVNWDGERRAVTGSRSGREVRLTIGSNTAYVNNAPQALDVPAAIVGGSTFVPLRFVGEALGATVQWDSANSAVRITLGSATPATPGPSAAAPAPVSKTISITDSYNNTVLVPSPPKRIVVCNGNAAEAISALGAADLIVGRSTTTAFPPSLQAKPSVGSWFTPSAEKIISLKPDIFFGYGKYTDKGIVAKLENSGIPVVMLDCYFLNTMAQDMTTLGKILGKEKEAADFNAFYTKYLNLAVDRTKDIPESSKLRLYVDYYTDYGTVSKGSASEDLLIAAGARNLADNLGVPFPKISSEWVIAQNPQVIFKICGTSVANGYGQSTNAMKRKHQEIMQRPGWSRIDAVKNGRIMVIANEIFTNVRAPVGILYMAKYLYPDLFEDVDPDAIHREWLSKFYGLPPDGAWIYPQI